MQGITPHIISSRFVRGLTSGMLLVLAVVVTGCASGRVFAVPTQSSLGQQGSADDHLAASVLYRQESQRLEAAAQQYQQKAMTIRPEEDPKAFRRSGLLTAASANRQDATAMQRLSAMHQQKAATMKAEQGLK